MLKKELIKIIVISGVVLFVPALLFIIFVHFIYPIATFWARETNTARGVYSLVTKTLQIPYQGYKRVDEPYMYKEEWQDLEPISEEEWLSMKCEHPKTESGEYFTTYMAENILSHEGQKQIHCVTPIFWDERHPYINKMPKHCTSIFNCSAIDIAFYDYILQYPKVLNNVIKIMEKPCNYLYDNFPIPTTAYHPSEEERQQLIKENKLFTYNGVVYTKNLLYCNTAKIKFYEQDRSYSVIYILDKDGNKKTEIIVPRKDNVHLIDF